MNINTYAKESLGSFDDSKIAHTNFKVKYGNILIGYYKLHGIGI